MMRPRQAPCSAGEARPGASSKQQLAGNQDHGAGRK